jgi:DNA-binding NtrC family response regulator
MPMFVSVSSGFSSTYSQAPDQAEIAPLLGAKVAEPGRQHVLVVDDENLIADSVAEILNRNGFDAEARYSGVSALRYLEQRRPDIIVTDVILPDLDGIRLAKAASSLCPGTRIVLFSGNVATAPLLDLALVEGYSFELLPKPVHPSQLLRTLRS